MPLTRTFTAAALFAIAIAVPAFADDFYEQQLQIAKIDFAAGRTVQAADELRIAAFGFLDRPPLLTEALARLALAQSTLGQASLVTQTLGRFIDVEQRFGTYPALPFDAPTRSKFEALLLGNVSPQTLRSVPTLAKIARTPVDAAGDLPPAQRIAAYEAGFRREPQNVQWPLALMRYYAASGEQAEVARWAQRAVNLDPKNSEARLLLVHAYASRGECRGALAAFAALSAADLQSRPDAYADQGVCLVETGKTVEARAAFAKISEAARNRPDVRKAIEKIAASGAATTAPQRPASGVPLTKPATVAATAPTTQRTSSTGATSTAPVKRSTADTLAQAHALVENGKFEDALRDLRLALQSDPSNRQLRLAILEAAVLSKEWAIASAQVAATSPYFPGEELPMFYASVTLYESGRRQEAKPLMERARPRMVSNPMVDFYANAVLGNAQ